MKISRSSFRFFFFKFLYLFWQSVFIMADYLRSFSGDFSEQNCMSFISVSHLPPPLCALAFLLGFLWSRRKLTSSIPEEPFVYIVKLTITVSSFCFFFEKITQTSEVSFFSLFCKYKSSTLIINHTSQNKAYSHINFISIWSSKGRAYILDCFLENSMEKSPISSTDVVEHHPDIILWREYCIT